MISVWWLLLIIPATVAVTLAGAYGTLLWLAAKSETRFRPDP